MIILNLIQNIALLMALVMTQQLLANSTFVRRLRRYPFLSPVFSGLVFGGVGIIGMMMPLHFAPGIIFDGRSIILSVAGLFGGPLVAAVAASLCGAYRLWVDGGGSLMGISVICEAAALGVVFHYLWRRNLALITNFMLLGFGFLVHAVMVGMMMLLPVEFRWDVLGRISLPVLLLYPVATMLFCRLIINQQNNIKNKIALDESEKNYRELVELANSIILRWKPDGTITFFNEFAEKFFGYSKEEILGQSVLGTIVPERDSANHDLRAMIVDIARNPEKYVQNENENMRKDGSRISVSWTNKAIFDAAGTITEILAIGSDFTERKLADDAIKTVSDHQNALLGAIPDIVMEVDEHKVYTWANVQGIAFFGDDVVGREAAFYFEGEQGTYQQVDPLFHGDEETIYLESWQRRRDGQKRLLAWWSHVLKDSQGNVTGAISSARDITERNNSEQELRMASQKWRTTFDTIIDPVALLSIDGLVEQCNQAFVDFLGLNYPAVLGRKCTQLLHRTDGSISGCPAAKARVSGVRETMELQVEEKFFLVVADPIKAPDGKITGFVHIMLNITERMQAEKALRKSEEANRALLDATVDAACILDFQGNFICLNKQLAARLGKTVNELMGTSAMNCFTPDIAAARQAKILTIMQSGMPDKFEDERDGRIYDNSIYPILEDNGVASRVAIYSHDITEERHYEQTLKSSLEHLRAYFYLPIIGIATTSTTKGWIDINPKLCQMLGYTETELRTKSWTELTPAEDAERDNDIHARILSGEYTLPYTFEKRFIKKDGTIITTELSTDAIGGGDSDLFIALIQDITDRKQAAAALDQSMNELKAIYDGTQVMLCVIDSERRVTQSNRAFAEFTVRPNNAIAQERVCGVFGCINALDDPRGCGYGPHCKMCGIYTAIADTLSTGRIHTDIEYRTTLLRKGRREDVSLLCSTVMISSGDEPKVLVSFLDVTARERAGEALMQSEENYRQLFDAESDAIFLIDNATSCILQANKAAASLYGYEHNELLKLKSTDISAQSSNGFQHIQAMLPVAGQIVTIPLRQHRRKDGTEFPVEITARSFLQNGRAVHLAAIRDITERMRSEKELDQYQHHLEELVRMRTDELGMATQAAESANRAKSMFLANMSHEFRSPMNAIIGFSEILEKLVKDARQRQYVKRIRESGSALLTLLNDILDFSKIEAGKMDLRQEPVSLQQVGEDVCRMFSQLIEEKNIELCIEVDQSVPGLVLVDPGRLRQILLNLIGNAVKFTEAGRVRVCMNAHDMQGEEGSRRDIIIAVKDTGIGIPEDELERIFEPFEQQKGPVMKVYGGTGLGLSITKSLVESMGGRIRVESRVGEGSVFTVELPVAEVVKGELEQKGEIGRGEYDDVRFRQALVLAVDDIDYNREIIKGFYDGLDIEVEEAKNGLEALEKARQRKPDLILLDMKMPVMDGYEFMQVLQNEKVLRDIPVIAVTAHALKEEELRIRALCQGYMCKPLCRDDLIRETMQFLPYTEVSTAFDAKPEAEIGEGERAALVAGLPDELARALTRAADMADVGRMRELIGEVEKIDGRLGSLLAGYAASYNYNGIGEVLKGGKQ